MAGGFANGPADRRSIPDRVVLKTQKMVLNASLLNTQHYKKRIKGKREEIQGKEQRPRIHCVVVAIEKGASTTFANFTFMCICL